MRDMVRSRREGNSMQGKRLLVCTWYSCNTVTTIVVWCLGNYWPT